MDKFKGYRVTDKGAAGFEEFQLDDLDPGDVVVRVSHSTVNYKDALAATGKHHREIADHVARIVTTTPLLQAREA